MKTLERYQRFWLDFAVSRAKLAWFRAVFFALVGVDAFLQISHAPRYGAGDFNVPHIPGLDALLPGPSRAGMLAVFLLQAYLGFRVACGAASRVALGLLTGLYGYGYFISQLDSYQHHYFVFLVLLLCCFVPWQEAEASGDAKDAARSRGPSRRGRVDMVPSWALRLIFVQVAILYFWAGVAKMDAAWLDGTALSTQLDPGTTLRDMAEWIGLDLAAALVLLAELFLAVAVLVRKLWLPALVVGVGMHISIELAGFEIGIFSYFMFALYVLLLPDGLVQRGSAVVDGVARRVRALLGAVASSAAGFWVAAAAMLALGTALLVPLPFREITAIAAVIAIAACVSVAGALLRGAGDRRFRALTLAAIHLAACAAVLVVHLDTEQAHDYYKYWGGTSRRLGSWDEAKIAYQTLTRISPAYGSGHYHLGNIARREGRLDDALASYERAQQASPEDYRAFLQAAELHHRAGRGAEALAAATRVLELEPRNQRARGRARTLYEYWSGASSTGASSP